MTPPPTHTHQSQYNQITKTKSSRAWWRTPLVPALGRQRQADFWVRGQPGLQSECQDSQGYTEKPCLKKTKQKNLKAIPLMNKHVKLQQNIKKLNLMKNWYNICKSINISHQIMKDKNHHRLNTFRKRICWRSAFLQGKKKKKNQTAFSKVYWDCISSQWGLTTTHSLYQTQWGKGEIVPLRSGSRQIYSTTLYWSLHIIHRYCVILYSTNI
jgi:hypothetical protein